MKLRSRSVRVSLRLAAAALMLMAFGAARPASAQHHSKVLSESQEKTLDDFRKVYDSLVSMASV